MLFTMPSANKPDAPNPATAPRFQINHHWRRVGDPERSAMRTRLPHCISVVLVVLAFQCIAADTSNSLPTLVVRQFPDYPRSGGSRFPDGLIAALWSDGRMIRPAGSNTIGQSYVEGVVSATDRDKFFTFLTNSAALRNQELGAKGIPLHEADQIVTLYRGDKKSRWRRPLPDRKAGFYELEERLWSLPLQTQRPVDWQAIRRSSWYE
jgi:hypothetical protein